MYKEIMPCKSQITDEFVKFSESKLIAKKEIEA